MGPRFRGDDTRNAVGKRKSSRSSTTLLTFSSSRTRGPIRHALPLRHALRIFSNRGGYGSPLSRGRHKECRRQTEIVTLFDDAPHFVVLAKAGAPYPMPSRCGTTGDLFKSRWLWVPAFAGTTQGMPSANGNRHALQRRSSLFRPRERGDPYAMPFPCATLFGFFQTALVMGPRFRGDDTRNVVGKRKSSRSSTTLLTLSSSRKRAPHTPCPPDVARPVISSNRGGYGSPLSRGRHKECRRQTEIVTLFNDAPHFFVLANAGTHTPCPSPAPRSSDFFKPRW